MTPLANTILGALLLAFGALAVTSMLVVQGRAGEGSQAAVRKWTFLHRTSGLVFVAIYLFLMTTMLERLTRFWEVPSPRVNVHETLAVALLFLIALKLSITRFFPKLIKHAFGLGVSVYLSSFVLVVITGGYFMYYRTTEAPYISIGSPSGPMLDISMGKELFIRKCMTCHDLEDVLHHRSEAGWGKVVEDMVQLARPRINPAEAEQILHYLVETRSIDPRKLAGNGTIERHCLPCHDVEEILKRDRDRSDWARVVRRMSALDSEAVPLGKMDEIVTALAGSQKNHGGR